jgi:hypothetical protein
LLAAFEEVLTRAVPEGASELEDLLHFAQDVTAQKTWVMTFIYKDGNLTGAVLPSFLLGCVQLTYIH